MGALSANLLQSYSRTNPPPAPTAAVATRGPAPQGAGLSSNGSRMNSGADGAHNGYTGRQGKGRRYNGTELIRPGGKGRERVKEDLTKMAKVRRGMYNMNI